MITLFLFILLLRLFTMTIHLLCTTLGTITTLINLAKFQSLLLITHIMVHLQLCIILRQILIQQLLICFLLANMVDAVLLGIKGTILCHPLYLILKRWVYLAHTTRMLHRFKLLLSASYFHNVQVPLISSLN